MSILRASASLREPNRLFPIRHNKKYKEKIMNRNDIKLLQSIRGYPAVSILLPTHRTSPDNRQDPIRVKNLVKAAAERLLGEFAKRDVETILARLETLAGQIDYHYTLDGLAMFVNRDLARKFYLPFTLKERVVIDETFATRDLVFALNRGLRYWVLSLSEQPTRLYEGWRDTLVEITEGGFPMTHEGPGGAEPLPGGFGVKKSAYRDERHRQFFRQVDAAFGKLAAEDPLPLVLVGVDRYLAFFNEVSKHKAAVIATLTGSHDKTAPHELAKLVWPLAQANLLSRRQEQAMQALNTARAANKFAAGVDEVWDLARDGRGAILLVEEDFHYPATLDASGLHRCPPPTPPRPA